MNAHQTKLNPSIGEARTSGSQLLLWLVIPYPNGGRSVSAMPPDLFRDAALSIPCPTCGHKTKRKIARLQTHPDVVCARCGGIVRIKINVEEFRKALEVIQETIDDARRKRR